MSPTPGKNKFLGVDIGGSGIKGAPVHVKKGVLITDRYRIPTPKPATPKQVAQVVADISKHFKWTGPIGCTIPGIIRGTEVVAASNLSKKWIGRDAARTIEKRTKSPVAILNDADAAGLAEVTFGAGRGQKGTILVLTFGTGIGSAIFRNGENIPNTELGQLRFDKKKTWEDLAADSARSRDHLSWKTWAKRRVQPYLNHLEFLFSPDMIIVGGGVSRPNKWDLIEPNLQTRATLRPAILENEAGIVGAAIAAKQLAKRLKANGK